MDTPPNSGFTMESSLIASQYVLFALDADDWALDGIKTALLRPLMIQ